MLSKAYIDGGIRQDWDGDLKVAVYTDGEVNNPARNATFWSVEMSISLQRLINGTTATLPKDNHIWSMIFARSEWRLLVQNRTFIKDATSDADWWSWEVTGAVNLHIPSSWGLVQFKVNKLDKTFTDDRWHIYRVLYDMFDALKIFKAKYGMYTTDLNDLGIPSYIFTSQCASLPNVTLTQTGGVDDFSVSVASNLLHVGHGHIRGDRYIWFD
ncbi:hypothetical protein ACJMK2_036118 [Sinanodonta woodiana]|uniref:Uncharacterized protein n=1 Tax=Sinanodonta woodiana TaxID=1069815 RepID=A0ABD3WG84_SINWO